MSAYMVEKDHIQYLVDSARKLSRGGFTWYWDGNRYQVHGGKRGNASEVGQMLWEENLMSINSRYPGGSVQAGYEYIHDPVGFPPELNLVQLIKSIQCYQYQACEHKGWADSQAKAMTDGMLAVIPHQMPGYGEAAWGAPPKTSKAILLSDLANS